MKNSLQITFRHMETSPAVEARIREEVEVLERNYDRITSCRVVIEAPHQSHRRGNEFHVNIDLHVPGSQIVVNHAPSLHAALVSAGAQDLDKSQEVHPEHQNIYISIRDAFAAARRQLDEHVRSLRGETRRHAAAAMLEAR